MSNHSNATPDNERDKNRRATVRLYHSVKMAPKVETLVKGLTLAEGPHWDASAQSLYFTDMPAKEVHRYVPATGKHTKASAGDYTSVIVPVKDQKNRFVLTLANKVVTVSWDGERPQVSDVKVLYEVDKGTPNVFNDGKSDPTGRFWAGTMGHAATSTDEEVADLIPDEQGTLYSFGKEGAQAHRSKIGIANGLAFNTKLNKFYYVDSYRGTVDQYDIDFQTGKLSNFTKVFHKEKHGLDEGLFDGMTIDSDGNLWVAVFNTGRVIQIDPRKPDTLLQTVKIPTNCVTSVAFGGQNLDELYVTSAKFTQHGSNDGFLFKVTGVGAKGLPGDDARRLVNNQ